jgi:Competence protein CoiA-like family
LYKRSLSSKDGRVLVAYGPDGRPVIAEETALEQLQGWSRERVLYCPNCRGIVHVRGGLEKRTSLHFAHQRGECAWSTEAESVRHARGKIVLAQWLREQFPHTLVTLEERLPEPNRIADIFVSHPSGERWAVEFQCAPLDVDEWRHRHTAYRKANILDIWIIGNNRREKQEAFLEAIIASAREVMFLDPLVSPPRIWLRWPVSRENVQCWQQETTPASALAGWVGRSGYGASLPGRLHEVCLGESGKLSHPVRSAWEARTRLLHSMSTASSIDETMLLTYLRQNVSEETVRRVILPLVRAYLRDPQLLRRYNYGRGQLAQTLSEEDKLRVQRARQWLHSLAQKGFTTAQLQELAQEMPFAGPYAALVSYMEMLIALA